MDLAALQRSLSGKDKLPPVEQWNPSFCGDIPLEIKANGQWFYMGTPIGRMALVKLFSSVLKIENKCFYLVTPVEKVGIQVEDAPFVVTQWREEGDYLVFGTSLGDEVVASAAHQVALLFNQAQQEWLPYIHIRSGLQARFHQNVYYQLVDKGITTNISPQNGANQALQLKSGDYHFNLGYL